MEQGSLTARISAFARAWHREHNEVTVFDDCMARRLLGEEDYGQIAAQMTAGIAFFAPNFSGTPAEALRTIVDHQLSPSPLGRAAFAERALAAAVRTGAAQYVILGAGYDTFAYRQPAWGKRLTVFEVDRPAMSREKRARLARAGIVEPANVRFVEADLAEDDWPTALLRAGFRPEALTFCSLLGVTYYLPPSALKALFARLGGLLSAGSGVAFDMPTPAAEAASDDRSRKQEQLAAGAKEPMFAGCTEAETTRLLEASGFLTYEHLTPEEVTKQLFGRYNQAHEAAPLQAMPNVDYYLAVRRA